MTHVDGVAALEPALEALQLVPLRLEPLLRLLATEDRLPRVGRRHIIGARLALSGDVENRENALSQHTLEAQFVLQFLVCVHLQKKMPIPSAVPKGA